MVDVGVDPMEHCATDASEYDVFMCTMMVLFTIPTISFFNASEVQSYEEDDSELVQGIMYTYKQC